LIPNAYLTNGSTGEMLGKKHGVRAARDLIKFSVLKFYVKPPQIENEKTDRKTEKVSLLSARS
jgi:hypothetical protein